MSIRIPIISEFDGKGIEGAIKQFKNLEGAGAKAEFALKKAALPAAAALGALGIAAKGAIQEAIKSQSEQNRLTQILRTTTGATDDQIAVLGKQAAALQKVGVASAGNIQVAQAQLATFDLQISTIKQLTPALTDYVIAEKGATASAEDFKSMTNALAGALSGNFGALTKSGFVLDETTKNLISNGTESERAAALVSVLNSTYKDFNETARDTAEGRMVALQNSFADLKTKIGVVLLPVFEKLVGYLMQVATFAERNSTVLIILGGVIGSLAAIVLIANAGMKAYAAGKLAVAAATFVAGKAQLFFNAVLTANPIGLAIVAIAALIAAFVFLEKRFGVVTIALKFVGDMFHKFLIQPIQTAIALIGNLINAISRIPAIGGIGKIAGAVTGFLGNIPGLADGGIVSRPTLAMIGEAGPEAVVPLNRAGGMGTTINIYSTIADETLPEKLVQALRSYNRTTGPVRIQVI